LLGVTPANHLRGLGYPGDDRNTDVSRKEITMGDTEKLENTAQEKMGEAKEALGKAADDKDLETEGKADQMKGDLKQAGEKVKDAFS